MYQFLQRYSIGWTPITQAQPVAWGGVTHVAQLLVHRAVGLQPCGHILHLLLHGSEVVLQYLAVAILHIEFPRHGVHGCAPCHTASCSRLPGSGVGHVSRQAVLCIAYVTYPFLVESRSVEVVHHCCAGRLTVSGVGQTLAVRAVAGYSAVHVVQLRALPYFIDAVEEGVCGVEVSGPCHVGIHYVGRQILGGKLVDARYHGLAEGKPGEARCILLIAAAVHHVAHVALHRLAHVIDLQRVALCALEVTEVYPARYLLAEIYHPRSVLASGEADGLHGLHYPVGGSGVGAHFRLGAFDGLHVLPSLAIVAGGGP